MDYQSIIDDYVTKNRDLHLYELAPLDWDAIKLVTGWLKSFWSATTEMSATKWATISFTHTIFCGLQQDLCSVLADLPATTSPELKVGLIKAHWKLSDYYNTFNSSPYYVWASSELL